jgi:MFS family permease
MPVIVPVLLAFMPLLILSVVQFSLPVLAPILMTALHQSPEQYGLFGGAFGVGAVYFLLVNTSVSPVFGPIRTLALGLACAALGLLLILSGIWSVALVGAFLLGFGYATTTPAGSQILTDFTPRNVWGTLFSLRQSAVPVGGLIAGIACARFATAYGWRMTLLIGMIATLLTGFFFILVPRSLNDYRPLQRFNWKGFIRLSNLMEPFRVLRTTPGLSSLVAAGMGLSAVHGAVTSFFVLFLAVDQHMPLEQAGTLFAVLQTWGMLGRIAFGVVADRIGSPLPLLRIQAPMSALCALVTAAFSVEWPVATQYAAASLIGLSVGTWNGLYLAEIARLSAPNAVARSTAGAAFFGFSTYMIIPPLMGLGIIHVGYRASFVLVSFAAVVASLIFILRRAPHPHHTVSVANSSN